MVFSTEEVIQLSFNPQSSGKANCIVLNIINFVNYSQLECFFCIPFAFTDGFQNIQIFCTTIVSDIGRNKHEAFCNHGWPVSQLFTAHREDGSAAWRCSCPRCLAETPAATSTCGRLLDRWGPGTLARPAAAHPPDVRRCDIYTYIQCFMKYNKPSVK